MKLSEFLRDLDLSEDNQQGSSRLQVILKILKKINSSLVLEEVLELVLKNAIRLTMCERGYIVLKTETGELENVLSLNSEGQRVSVDQFNISRSVVNDVFSIGQCRFIESALNTPTKASESITNLELQTIMCAPLQTEGETIGVLYVDSRTLNKIESKEITETFEVFASQAGIAINNALMHGRQHKANEELKRAYSELEIAKREAEKLDQLKNHFLTQMSHEIRTPFNIIQSSLYLLKSMISTSSNPDVKDIFGMLEDGSNRIIRTVDRIMEMAKIRSGYYEIFKEKIRLSEEILQDIVSKFERNAQEKGIYLSFQKATEIDSVECDRFMVYQIFQEIVDNAIKFTEKGAVRIKQFSDANDKLSVSIQDTGIGIDPTYLDNLFQNFSQEDYGVTRKYEGNGLALALVKKYAELNNITIFVESEKYRGSTFTITFNR